MHIVKKNEYSYDNDSNWSELVWYGYLSYLEDVKRDLDAIGVLIDYDFKDIPDKTFYNLVSNFYSIYLYNGDILNIISRVKGIQYDRFEALNSRMVFKDIVSEGHGRDFSWWEETFQVNYIVAVAEDFTIDPNHNYSKEDIEEMAKNKQIVAIDSYSKDIGMNPKLSFIKEEPTNVDIDTLRLGLGCDFLSEYDNIFQLDLLENIDSEFASKVYKTAISLIKKRLNKKKVLNECKQILLFLNENMGRMNEAVNHFDGGNEYLDLSHELVASHQKLLSKIVH